MHTKSVCSIIGSIYLFCIPIQHHVQVECVIIQVLCMPIRMLMRDGMTVIAMVVILPNMYLSVEYFGNRHLGSMLNKRLTHTFCGWNVLRPFNVDKTQSIVTTNPQHMLYSSPVILRVMLHTLSVGSSFYTCRAS